MDAAVYVLSSLETCSVASDHKECLVVSKMFQIVQTTSPNSFVRLCQATLRIGACPWRWTLSFVLQRIFLELCRFLCWMPLLDAKCPTLALWLQTNSTVFQLLPHLHALLCKAGIRCAFVLGDAFVADMCDS